MVMVIIVVIDVDVIYFVIVVFEIFIEVLFGFINWMNYVVDWYVCVMVCDCLKEFEMVYLCLLSLCVGYVFLFCQSEWMYVS